MNLIIVESPTKARTLSKFLGKEYQVESTMGHVRDLPQKKLGVDTAHDFDPTYVVVAGKKAAIKKLQVAAKKAKKIYLATDPDREGEAIAWHAAQVIQEAKKGKKEPASFSRIVFHEITAGAVKKALSKPGSLDMNLVSAQTARRVLDRLVGYKLSPLLWYKVRKGLSAGRVQSVTVRLIVEKEREIEKFIPVEFWEIDAELKGNSNNDSSKATSFLARLVGKNGEKFGIGKKPVADETVTELENCGYELAKLEKKEVKRHPAPPFITSTLQRRASSLFGWSAKRTMVNAQKLYEQGLITYHRTDSVHLAVEAVNQCRNYITKEYGDQYLPEKVRFYKTKSKSAQEAHEAVRPTNVGQFSIFNFQFSNKDEEKLYRLIWKRFVACQMKEALVEVTKIEVLATGKTNHYLLETKGEVEKFDGWRKVWDKGKEDLGEEQLPALNEGEDLDLIKILSQQKFTQPPPRYTEASLIKKLEQLGIGRPSTYAPTITTIQARQYVEKEEKKLKPSKLGIAVNDFLVEHFDDILDYQFTAKMEADLDEIADGKKEWVPIIRDFYIPFNIKLTGVSQVAERVKIETEATGENCPDCKDGSVVIRVGRFGKFLSCSRFPECKWKASHVEKTGQPCPKCKKGDMIVKKTRKGRKFYGCSVYPKCDWASWKKPK